MHANPYARTQHMCAPLVKHVFRRLESWAVAHTTQWNMLKGELATSQTFGGCAALFKIALFVDVATRQFVLNQNIDFKIADSKLVQPNFLWIFLVVHCSHQQYSV